MARSPAPVAERVVLESDDSDEVAVPAYDAARKVQAHVKLHSRVRGGRLALEVFNYRYLAVHLKKMPWSAPVAFVADLRFVDGNVERRRRIPKRWWQVSAGLFFLCAIAIWLFSRTTAPWSNNAWFAPLVFLCAGAVCVALVSTYLTTETVSLRSRNGRARLLEFTGGVGTFRALRAFETKLAAHIRHAIAASSREKAQQLRAEMREHQRLREQGILTGQDYEESKARILRSHD
jgi:hypothetical protein